MVKNYTIIDLRKVIGFYNDNIKKLKDIWYNPNYKKHQELFTKTYDTAKYHKKRIIRIATKLNIEIKPNVLQLDKGYQIELVKNKKNGYITRKGFNRKKFLKQ